LGTTRRIFRSIAFRQLVVIAVAIFLVRFALNNVLRVLAKWSSSPVPWDKSKLYYVMKEVRGVGSAWVGWLVGWLVDGRYLGPRGCGLGAGRGASSGVCLDQQAAGVT